MSIKVASATCVSAEDVLASTSGCWKSKDSRASHSQHAYTRKRDGDKWMRKCSFVPTVKHTHIKSPILYCFYKGGSGLILVIQLVLESTINKEINR